MLLFILQAKFIIHTAPNSYSTYIIQKFVLLKSNSYVLLLNHTINSFIRFSAYITKFTELYDSDPTEMYQTLIICCVFISFL